MSIPPSMKPKLFAGDTIASAEGAPLKISPQDICQQQQSATELNKLYIKHSIPLLTNATQFLMLMAGTNLMSRGGRVTSYKWANGDVPLGGVTISRLD